MSTRPPPDEAVRATVRAAATCAAAVLASQLAGKAARDAIFLQRFPVTNLPVLLAVSSALSIAATFFFAHRMRHGVPTRVVQVTNLVSAALLMAEWALLDRFPRPVATVIYMHQTLIGPILVSGFWSVVSEAFDPRTARRVIGTIGTGATIGGVAGALLAERVAAMIGTEALLPAIACVQTLVTWRFGVLARAGTAAQPVEDEPEAPHVKEVAAKISGVSLLRRLAMITVVVTIAAALLDYVFKVSVTESVRHSDDLARVFATFHGVVGVLTAVVSWQLGRRALQSWGLANTLATLPGAVIVFGALGLIFPGAYAFAALRGAEQIVRNSLYREAYEVFYTPLQAAERRRTKTVIDVGVERFGDVLGGLAVLAVLALAVDSTRVLLLGALAMSVVGVVVALQAQRSYVEALERSLLDRAIEISNEDARDRTTRTTLEHVAQRATRAVHVTQPDGDLDRLRALRSGDPVTVRRALAEPLTSAGVAYAIPLLVREDVARDADRALRAVARAFTGQLLDAMRDPALSPRVRAKLPSIVAAGADDVARAALVACLGSPDLEVRFGAAKALAGLRERDPELVLDEAAVLESVRRELADSTTALDLAAHDAEQPSRCGYLATLLSLTLPAESVKTAFYALSCDDVAFRGVALEYLDNVLPGDIRDQLWLALAIEAPAAPTKRPVEDVRADLLRPRQPRAAS